MTEIVSVRFKDAGKVYYFDPNGLKVRIGDNVIVETARGVECATVAAANRFVEDDSLVSPLKPILRIATAEDKATLEKNKQKEREAYEICVKKIEDHGLDMSLSEVEYAFDGSKIIFFSRQTAEWIFASSLRTLPQPFTPESNCAKSACAMKPKCLADSEYAADRFVAPLFLMTFIPFQSKWQRSRGSAFRRAKSAAPAAGLCAACNMKKIHMNI